MGELLEGESVLLVKGHALVFEEVVVSLLDFNQVLGVVFDHLFQGQFLHFQLADDWVFVHHEYLGKDMMAPLQLRPFVWLIGGLLLDLVDLEAHCVGVKPVFQQEEGGELREEDDYFEGILLFLEKGEGVADEVHHMSKNDWEELALDFVVETNLYEKRILQIELLFAGLQELLRFLLQGQVEEEEKAHQQIDHFVELLRVAQEIY